MRYKTSTYTTLAGFFAALALQGQSATYSVTDLGTLPGGTYSQAFI